MRYLSRKLQVVAVGAALALAAAACGGDVGDPEEPDTDPVEDIEEDDDDADDADEDADEDAAAPDGDIVIGMMPKLTGIPYFNAAQQGAQEAADELGVTLDFDGPTSESSAAQVELIEQWTAQGYDAISVSATDPDALAPAMTAAGEAGIGTSTWDADVNPDARDVFVNQATAQGIGFELVDIMAEQTGGEGEFLIVTGSLTAPNQNAWIAAMEERIESEYPDMVIAAIEPGDEDLEQGIDVTRAYLQANPDTAGVFGITSVALPGAAEAVEQLGLVGDVVVTGLGVPSEAGPYVDSGAIEEFALWNPIDLGYLALYVAYLQATGELPESGTFEAGRLGEVGFADDGVIELGPAFRFNADNIGDFDF
ncbi:MAG: autoinducer 2 ABC transporter substrate-binding protein [Nitriliruptor sp.]|nr:MAG: autoinducer 2 ABC transporter substrate-binding protein [Nitriliruptor sp.]